MTSRRPADELDACPGIEEIDRVELDTRQAVRHPPGDADHAGAGIGGELRSIGRTCGPAALFIAAGPGVAFGSDAPFGNIDPWAMIASAVDRVTVSGDIMASTRRSIRARHSTGSWAQPNARQQCDAFDPAPPICAC